MNTSGGLTGGFGDKSTHERQTMGMTSIGHQEPMPYAENSNDTMSLNATNQINAENSAITPMLG